VTDTNLFDGLAVLSDRVAIGDLSARYNRAFDDGDVPAFVATFTPGGVIEEIGGDAHVGADAITAFVEREFDGTTVHATTDALVTVDGDVAHQRCTLILMLRKADRSAVSLFTTGRYDDELVRTSAGWRFTRRVIALDRQR
jgi:ketosteroid isomerase-like protein